MQNDLNQEMQELMEDLGDTEEVQRAKRSVADMRQAAQDFLHRSADILKDGAARAKDVAGRASDRTSTYVHDNPLQSLLIAAGTGALIALIVNNLSHRRRD